MKKPVIIAGAGLVGSLLSILLAKKGFKVSVFERRADMRNSTISAGKSINLALSDRGWKGLEKARIEEEIKKIAIPMFGRMIHNPDGKINFLPYGKENQAINSVSRGELNKTLMTMAENHGAIISFNQRLINSNLITGTHEFENLETGAIDKIDNAVLFGTDGAFSAARLSLQLQTDRFEYSQHFLEHGYKELNIPAKPGGEFAMEKNALHIWPRGKFMLIALPNIDGSFTCTLFFPFEGEYSFSSLNSRDKMMKFFRETFPDAVELMPTLEEDYFNNPSSSLVTVKCFPWAHGDKSLLLGDAAHAIVPFFGQGMNCGFEDCSLLDDLLNGGEVNWQETFESFQRIRKPNSDAIAELAVNNFIEMRDLVSDPKFLLRKKIESDFNKVYPDKWLPLYSMVTFSHLPYKEALREGIKQDRIMSAVMKLENLNMLIESGKINDIILQKLSE